MDVAAVEGDRVVEAVAVETKITIRQASVRARARAD